MAPGSEGGAEGANARVNELVDAITSRSVPESVPSHAAGSYRFANDIRAAIKQTAKLADDLRKQLQVPRRPTAEELERLLKESGNEPLTTNAEAIANATLAYRHLEDASMRLGKVLQALDGGVSVYDKATTVGA